jgi:rubrerythrin
MPTVSKRGRPSLPPPQPVRPPVATTFVVRCTTCGRRFEVDRAPATCPACGGVAIAG